MKRIGIDCRLWDETGIGRYIRNIVDNIAKTDTQNEYVLFVLSKDFDQINLPSNFKKVRTDIRWYTLKEQLVLPFILYKQKLDILWVPNLNVPVLYLKRFAVTIHDLTVVKIKTGKASAHFYPLYLLKRFAVWLPLYFSARFARAIFTVSEYVRSDLTETLNIDEEKVFVTPCAVDSKFKKEPLGKITEVCTKYRVSDPYLFYVGNAHPHKNIGNLIKAFEIVKKDFPNMQLVLGGDKKFFYERIEQGIKDTEIAKSIRFIGYVDDYDLPALYSGAEAFVNASLYEGFGIQILEAFACETKVVCSNTTSLPEVGGNIAYYFNPRDINNMAKSIVTCLNDSSGQRISAGLARVKDFSWERSARIVHRNL
jgi:glycosyltransferase involved in cell wall biosynthesis